MAGTLGALAVIAGSGGAAAGTSSLSLTVTARNSCTPASLSAPAGEITLVLTNQIDDWQSFGISGVGAGTPERVRRGQSSSLTATFAPGTYSYWCGDDADDDDVTHGTLTVTGSSGGAPPPSSGGSPPSGGSGSPPAAGSISVTASDDVFAPSSLRAAAGSITVTVTNSGRSDHTFTIANVVNVVVPAGQMRTATFSAGAGTYRFFCAFHSGMAGTLVVEGASSAPPPSGGATPPPSGGGTPPPSTAPPPSPPPASGGAPAPSPNLTVTTSDFAFAPSQLSTPPGTVTLTVRNVGHVAHTFTIDGVVSVDVRPGESQTTTFTVSPGTYRVYCAHPNHAEAGMVGTLTVAAGTPASGGTPGPSAQPGAPTSTPSGTAPPASAPASSPASGSPSGLTITTTDFAFAPASLTVPAGTVTMTVTNKGKLPHTFTVDGLVNVDLRAGETKTVSFAAAPGTYRVYCAHAGHAEAGRVGTLVVTGTGASAGNAGSPASSPSAPGATAASAHHHHASHTAGARAAVAVACRRATRAFTLTGTLVATSSRSVVVDVAAATKAGAAYVRKRASVVRTGKTVVTARGSELDGGLKTGQRVRVTVGACRAGQKKASASRIALAPVTTPTAKGGAVLNLKVTANAMVQFDKKTLTAPAGRVTLRLTNASPIPHNISLKGYGAGKVVPKGGVSTVTAKLKAGRYVFVCAVPGHATGGMQGVLVVR